MNYEDFKPGMIFYSGSGEWEVVRKENNVVYAKKLQHSPHYLERIIANNIAMELASGFPLGKEVDWDHFDWGGCRLDKSIWL